MYNLTAMASWARLPTNKLVRAVTMHGRQILVPSDVQFLTFGDFRRWAVQSFGLVGPPLDYTIEINAVAGRRNTIQQVPCHAYNTFPNPPCIFLCSDTRTLIFEVQYDGEGEFAHKVCCAVM